MRLFLILITSSLISCSGSLNGDKTTSDTDEFDTSSRAELIIDLILADTPKILKAGKDYVIISASPHDKIYFGDKFSPYKIEPYDIADLEIVIDSIIKKENQNCNFINKSLVDFKYQVFSVKTTNQKLLARVQDICIEQAYKKKWNSSRFEIEDGGECYFSIIYDLIDNKVISFQINSNG